MTPDYIALDVGLALFMILCLPPFVVGVGPTIAAWRLIGRAMRRELTAAGFLRAFIVGGLVGYIAAMIRIMWWAQ